MTKMKMQFITERTNDNVTKIEAMIHTSTRDSGFLTQFKTRRPQWCNRSHQNVAPPRIRGEKYATPIDPEVVLQDHGLLYHYDCAIAQLRLQRWHSVAGTNRNS